MSLHNSSSSFLLFFIFYFILGEIIMDRRMMEKAQTSKGSHYKQTQLFGYKGPGEKVL